MSTLIAPAITTWNVDSTHSVVEFKVKHIMISYLKGQFMRAHCQATWSRCKGSADSATSGFNSPTSLAIRWLPSGAARKFNRWP